MKACQLGKKASPPASGTARNERGHGGELVILAPVNMTWGESEALKKAIAKKTWEENREGRLGVVGEEIVE